MVRVFLILALMTAPAYARHRVVKIKTMRPVVRCMPYGDGTMCGIPGGLPPQYFTDPTISTRNWAGGDGS